MTISSETQARNYLAGTALPPAMLEALISTLQDERRFGLARRVLERVRSQFEAPGSELLSPERRLVLARKLALCTYKDPDLPLDAALDRALAILREACTVEETQDQEVLGLLGAIFKRRWEARARTDDLERSLAYYSRGAEVGSETDDGYNAINAAFVLDLLAEQADNDPDMRTSTSPVTRARRERAGELRQKVLDAVPVPPEGTETNDDWWRLVTVAEAHFGLRDYGRATALLRRAGLIEGVADWKRESTARQLARLARCQNLAAGLAGATAGEQVSVGTADTAESALEALLGDQIVAVQSAIEGKIGLALSGGGFRASLFHIGVLANLAERDLLRRVEYLSCVSGGAIVGAHYYLEIQKLLLEKTDPEITRDDYIRIVQKVERDFLAGVQRNIRTRVAAEWLTNLKMIFLPNYSRTLRVGELYERELFRRVQDGKHSEPRWLDDLKVIPKGEPSDFAPKANNWRRSAKVPILVLNATSLNTGHNWQFTSSWMGEPPANLDSPIDANYRLRRMYFEEAPAAHRRVRLGHAVAASSCVPGLFEPLPLEALYPDRTVRLVDGGVHDNQGTASLLEQGCNVLLVSDASGQMDALDDPTPGLLSVPLRSNSILQARVREAQYHDLDGRRRAGVLQGLMFLHLKKDLEAGSVDWIGSQDPSQPVRATPMAPYGIQKHVQRLLAAVRTDLDFFSETEAWALMTSGYQMTEQVLGDGGPLGFEVPAPTPADWRFLCVAPAMQDPDPKSLMVRQLTVAGQIAFKVWRHSRVLQLGAGIAALLVLALLAYNWSSWSDLRVPTPSLGQLAILLIVALVVPMVWKPVLRLVRWRKTMQQVAIGVGMTTVGFLAARLHLHVFDKLFLLHGRAPQTRAVNKTQGSRATAVAGQ